MTLPDRVQAIVRALYERHTELARGDEEQRRTLTRMIAEQASFELGPSWGTKRADAGRPPSKDAIAYRPGDGRLLCWDWQNGTTREPIPNPEVLDITGQVFIGPGDVYALGDKFVARDHLSGQPPANPVEPQAGPEPSDSDVAQLKLMLAGLVGEVAALRAQVTALKAAVQAQQPEPPINWSTVWSSAPWPTYVGQVTLPFVGARSFRLTPEVR